MSKSPDFPVAVAKTLEAALSADLTIVGIGKLLVKLFYIDQVHAAGLLSDIATDCLGELTKAIEEVTGHPIHSGPVHLYSLACTYGRMATHASTPSKQDIIYHAFFSEFSEEFANDADNAIFRELVETLDYNEAVLLAGLWEWQNDCSLSTASPDYHVARRLLGRGELYVAVVKEEEGDKVKLIPTRALGKFAQFIKVKGVAPQVI